MIRTDAYRRWNAALATEYFRADDAERPVYLAVDDDELAELAPAVGVDPSRGSAAFVEAVRLEVKRGGDLFRTFLRESVTWRKDDTPEPPYVGLLALCVLAASRMARDPETRTWSNDYYSQLNALLGRERRAGRPPNFDELSRLWLDLAKWLDVDLGGERGRSTVRTHDFFVHIGHPISQCLLRASDRRRLPDFFRSVGLEPRAEVSGERLLVLFRAWARPGCPLTSQGQRVVANASGGIEQTLVEILTRELADWDGELRDERGRRRGEVVIFAESLAGGRRIELRLYARRPEGFPEGSWTLESGRTIGLAGAAQGWYGRLPLQVTSAHLSDGLALTSNEFALGLDAALAIPLRAAFLPDAGWISVRQATALEEHLVLAHASVEPELRAFLQRNGEPGWRVTRPAGELPGDWLMADRVRLGSVPRAVPDALRRLVPRLNTAMRFDGGLPLARQVYLEGGEPDLWITIDDVVDATIRIDDTVERLQGGIVKLPLRGLALDPGPHTVSGAGETRRFTSVRTYGREIPDGAGALGHVLERHGGYRPHSAQATEVEGRPPRGHVVVSGAHISAASTDLPADAFAPVVLRGGFSRYQLLGAIPGQVAETATPPKPRWLLGIKPIPTAQFFEYAAGFRAQLVIYTGAAGLKLRPAHGTVIPPVGGEQSVDPRGSCDWANTLLTADAADIEMPAELLDVWSQYLLAAQAITEGGSCPTIGS